MAVYGESVQRNRPKVSVIQLWKGQLGNVGKKKGGMELFLMKL
jgi:hypothetical protein